MSIAKKKLSVQCNIVKKIITVVVVAVVIIIIVIVVVSRKAEV